MLETIRMTSKRFIDNNSIKNATQLQSFPISTNSPLDTQVLSFSALSNLWQPTSTSTVLGGIVVLTTTNQTVAGVKTFSSAPVFSAITNTGLLTLPTSTTTLSGTSLAETFSGIKTFSVAPVISSITNTGTLTLPISSDTLVGRATIDTLTNKWLSTSTTYFTDTTDSTKIVLIDTHLSTTGCVAALQFTNTASRIISFPSQSINDSVVMLAAVQSMTNKTITSPTITLLSTTFANGGTTLNYFEESTSTATTFALTGPASVTVNVRVQRIGNWVQMLFDAFSFTSGVSTTLSSAAGAIPIKWRMPVKSNGGANQIWFGDYRYTVNGSSGFAGMFSTDTTGIFVLYPEITGVNTFTSGTTYAMNAFSVNWIIV